MIDDKRRKQEEQIHQILRFSGMGHDAIHSIFAELNLHNEAANYVQQGRRITLKDLVSHHNVRELIQSKYNNFSSELIHYLSRNRLSDSTVARGECENLFVLVGSDARFVGEGDISIEGMSIEMKCGDGHMCGQGITVGDIQGFHDAGVKTLQFYGIEEPEHEWAGERIIGRYLRELSKVENADAVFHTVYSKAMALYGQQEEARDIASYIAEGVERMMVPVQIGTYSRNSKHHKKGDPKYKEVLDRDLGKLYTNMFGIWQAYMYTKLSGVKFLLLINKNHDYQLFTNEGDFAEFFVEMNEMVVCKKGPKLNDSMCKATVVALK